MYDTCSGFKLLQLPGGVSLDEGTSGALCELPVKTLEDMKEMEQWLSNSANYKALVSSTYFATDKQSLEIIVKLFITLL